MFHELAVEAGVVRHGKIRLRGHHTDLAVSSRRPRTTGRVIPWTWEAAREIRQDGSLKPEYVRNTSTTCPVSRLYRKSVRANSRTSSIRGLSPVVSTSRTAATPRDCDCLVKSVFTFYFNFRPSGQHASHSSKTM